MQRCGSRSSFAVILTALICLTAPQGVPAADDAGRRNPHFPKPTLLETNVEFWRQIYITYGVGDFVVHDRERLGVIYGVVRVDESTDPARAADLAKVEIQRERAKYQDVLSNLASGVPPEELGPEGGSVWHAWKCPCDPEALRRAAGSIRVQQGLRQKVDKGIQRAQELLPRILAILQEHNVPVELAALPLVESAYDPQAHSKAGAVGLWQFIRSTGKQYLTITRARDDRRDPIRATEAAARLLRHNYEALGSWPLAILAYNHGKGGILAAREAVGSDAIEDIIATYTGRRFGFASKNFYAEFLAALEIFHPLLANQGPRQAKLHQPNAQHAALSARRAPVAVRSAPTPPSAVAPLESTPPVEASARSAEAASAAQTVAPETRPTALESPSFPTESPVDAATGRLP